MTQFKLAIKGHQTRYKEVIEILEMMGGKNNHCWSGDVINNIYYINDCGHINSCNEFEHSDYLQLTLEEFLEKFPYKVGDKVITTDKFIGTITDIKWHKGDSFFVRKEEGDILYTVQVSTNAQFTYQKEDLQPYKEEIKEEKIEAFKILETCCKDEVKIEFDPSKFEIIERENEYYVVRKKPKYPNTYEECCKVLVADPSRIIVLSNREGIIHEENKHCYEMYKLYQLLICRDAYWKIAGVEMGLGKSWEPDWKDCTKPKYTIHLHCDGHIFWQDVSHTEYRWLSFPTEEMRDAFYENFKDLIEKCKELL